MLYKLLTGAMTDDNKTYYSEEEDEDKYYRIVSKSRPRSPSRRRISSIHDNEGKTKMTSKEIDETIVKWKYAKDQLAYYKAKESKYKQIVSKIMDVTGADVISGKDLTVTRKVQNRRFISKALLPKDIFESYSKVREIPYYYIKEINYSRR